MSSAGDCQLPQHRATSAGDNQDTNSPKDIFCLVGADASDSNPFEQLWTKRDRQHMWMSVQRCCRTKSPPGLGTSCVTTSTAVASLLALLTSSPSTWRCKTSMSRLELKVKQSMPVRASGTRLVKREVKTIQCLRGQPSPCLFYGETSEALDDLCRFCPKMSPLQGRRVKHAPAPTCP